jgi:hypothetical protein
VNFSKSSARECSGSRAYLAIITFFALAVAGLSIWSLISSIQVRE